MFLNATNLIGLNTDTFKNASIILYYHDHNRIIIVIIVYYCDGYNDIGVDSLPPVSKSSFSHDDASIP